MKKTAGKLMITAAVMLLATSCFHERSNTTGWAYNDPSNGGFEKIPYQDQETGPGLVLIEGGTFTMGRTEDNVTYSWDNIPRRVTVSSFYMDETEISNFNWLEYLHWTYRVFAPNDFYEVYRKALPDTLVWREKLAYNEPFVDYYLRHPAYRDYPVVGVNWLQASDYCTWRTDRVNEFILVREGVIEHSPTPTPADYFNTEQYLAGKWQGQQVLLPSADPNVPERQVKMEDGIFLPKYRLPTEAEWEYAAYGLIGNTIGERITDRRIYPWNGHGVRNPQAKHMGDMNANYQRGAGDMMGTAGRLNDNAEITAPVYSYWPNDYGLYNMAGNVSEWVMDVYRPLTAEDADDFRPFRGNVYQTKVKDADGIVINTDSILYDKDSNIVTLPGQVKYRDVSIAYSEDNLDERRNYKQADNISYLDGDVESSVYYTEGEEAKTTYAGKLMYAYAKPTESSWSLIDDKARVYKGGSWRDRAYWMNPGTRRYLDQRQTSAFIGFRCAMTRVGSPVGFGVEKMYRKF